MSTRTTKGTAAPYPQAAAQRSGRSRALRVVDDLGEMPGGGCHARYVGAENGSEYIMKGPLLSPGHPYVASNEWIAAELASLLGLPVLNYRILEMNGTLYFGSDYMANETYYPYATERQVKQCDNIGRIYDIITFDAWICNLDRHERNLIIRKPKRPDGKKLLLLNDHSHCMIIPGETTADLARKLDFLGSEFVRWGPLRQMIVDPSALRKSFSAIESVADDEIQTVVQCTPSEFLEDSEKGAVLEYLVARKTRLRTAFEAARKAFPRLKKGEL